MGRTVVGRTIVGAIAGSTRRPEMAATATIAWRDWAIVNRGTGNRGHLATTRGATTQAGTTRGTTPGRKGRRRRVRRGWRERTAHRGKPNRSAIPAISI